MNLKLGTSRGDRIGIGTRTGTSLAWRKLAERLLVAAWQPVAHLLQVKVCRLIVAKVVRVMAAGLPVQRRHKVISRGLLLLLGSVGLAAFVGDHS